MALPMLADIDDVMTLMPGVEIDAGQVEALLRLASARVRAYARSDWVDEDDPTVPAAPDGITELVASMVVRALQNPRGVTQETAGPMSASYGSDAAARIYLTQQDKDTIDGVRSKSRLWILSPTRGDLETPPVNDCRYVEVE